VPKKPESPFVWPTGIVPSDFVAAKLEHSDVEVMAHPPEKCAGQGACPLHHRTVHSMRAMTQVWRNDTGLIERICEHGVGHFDPDQWEYLMESRGAIEAKVLAAHSCDGCCGSRLR
jgi:hypothetical protein